MTGKWNGGKIMGGIPIGGIPPPPHCARAASGTIMAITGMKATNLTARFFKHPIENGQ
jgi:hypothetical protein